MADQKNSQQTQPAAPAKDPEKAEKMERIEKYRGRVRELLGDDFPVDGGFATATVYYQGVEITVGQRAGSMYDALAALTYGLTLAQYELQVSVKAPESAPAKAPTSTTSTPAVGQAKPAAGPAVAGGPAVKPGGAQPDPGGNGNGQAGTGTMPVEVIILGQGGANPYWIVKGGKWKKHGVIVWPEVLEAWGVLEALDPLGENRIEGEWLAVYASKPNGNPDKVIRFEPANGQ